MKVAMVTSWGSVCGIAEHTRYFVDAVSAADPEIEFVILGPYQKTSDRGPYLVHRCWEYDSDAPDRLIEQVAALRPDVVHLQYQRAFFTEQGLGRLVRSLHELGVPSVVTFHATAPVRGVSLSAVADDLKLADLLLVHSPNDQARLRSWGLEGNVVLMPLGAEDFPDEAADAVRRDLGLSDYRPVIASFGFLQPHKGVLETIDATARLLREYPDILYMAVSTTQNNIESRMYLTECRRHISRLGLQAHAVILGRFLSVPEILTALHAADVIVMPYQKTGESASGAIRFALSSRRPVITSRQSIFADVSDATFQIDSPKPRGIASGIRRVLGDPSLRERLLVAQNDYIDSTSWPAVTCQYGDLIRSLTS